MFHLILSLNIQTHTHTHTKNYKYWNEEINFSPFTLSQGYSTTSNTMQNLALMFQEIFIKKALNFSFFLFRESPVFKLKTDKGINSIQYIYFLQVFYKQEIQPVISQLIQTEDSQHPTYVEMSDKIRMFIIMQQK